MTWSSVPWYSSLSPYGAVVTKTALSPARLTSPSFVYQTSSSVNQSW
ncbi:MAG TPA: hypothetical protein VF549_00565 [Solirubrobacteraceae bacterium]